MAYIGNKVNGGLADGNAVVSGTLDVSNNVTLSADVTIGDDLVLTDDLFFGTDATVINFGADNDVTLTHVHDTGILLNSSKQLQFGDSGTYIRQSSDGVLNLVADGDMVITADGVVIGASSTATVFEATGSKNDQWAGKFTNTNSGGYGVLAVTAGSTANEKAFEVRKNTSDTAMLIQGDGNVGIGTSSPNATLELSNSSSIPSISLGRSPFSTHGSLTIGGTGTGHLTSNTDSSGDSTVAVAAARISIGNGTIQFLNSGSTSAGSARTFSETMRIDSSGNLLVGQSSTALPGAGNTTTGISVSGEYDAIFASRSAGSALVVNRNSDGEIAQFRKDGSTVGSIGTQSGTLQIDGTSGSTGLLFGASNIYPRDNGANSDGGVDLGGSSIRFKDFYLSGKITGATQVTQDDNTSSLALAGGTDSNVGANMIVYGGSHSSLDGVVRFRNGSTNTARIDSSGNLMVGRTSLGISNTGHTLAAAGYDKGHIGARNSLAIKDRFAPDIEGMGAWAEIPKALVTTFELGRTGAISTVMIIFIFILLILTIMFIVFMERALRKILINYPKRQMGNKMYGGESSHLPLKINTAGVIPAIFASALLLLPVTLSNFNFSSNETVTSFASYFTQGQPLYMLLYASGIIFFTFFYTSLVFNPNETAENLRKYGGFIPGIRPGESTSKYIEEILTRLTTIGALYLTLVCLMPEFLISKYPIPFYLGGTSILIVVVVAIDTVTQIQTRLMSAQYEQLIKKTKFGR